MVTIGTLDNVTGVSKDFIWPKKLEGKNMNPFFGVTYFCPNRNTLFQTNCRQESIPTCCNGADASIATDLIDYKQSVTIAMIAG